MRAISNSPKEPSCDTFALNSGCDFLLLSAAVAAAKIAGILGAGLAKGFSSYGAPLFVAATEVAGSWGDRPAVAVVPTAIQSAAEVTRAFSTVVASAGRLSGCECPKHQKRNQKVSPCVSCVNSAKKLICVELLDQARR